jgi:delta-aminolevulinic acid dehydratase/porphobilinogen synthase
VAKGLASVLLFGVVNDDKKVRSLCTYSCRIDTIYGRIHICPLRQLSKLTVVHQDANGSFADDKHNPVVKAIKLLKAKLPSLLVVCDVCLCPYSDHGHCGILQDNGRFDVTASAQRIAEIALAYAFVGECSLYALSAVVIIVSCCHHCHHCARLRCCGPL